MKKITILLVDDEPKIVRFVKTSLNLVGYELLIAGTAEEALSIIEGEDLDLIVLDLGLPDMDGLEVLRRVREYSTIPVLILTARDDERDKVRGLELGADDYLTKPFAARELEARIAAVMRRVEWSPQPSEVGEFQARHLLVDLRRRVVTVSGEEVHLTPTEYELLRVLIQHAGQVLLHSDLLTRVWGMEYRNDMAILRVNISRLRQKLDISPDELSIIQTVPGVGYVMASEHPPPSDN
jgi:two-component system KDP operon response regulator KdpE